MHTGMMRRASLPIALVRRRLASPTIQRMTLEKHHPCLYTYRLSSTSSSAVTTTSQDEQLPAPLIDFSISAKIEGEESQVAMVELRPNEILRAEAGAMLFMTEGVEMDTNLQGASAAFSRMMTGQNVFLTDFRYNGQSSGTVGLGTDFPSKIIRLSLEDYPNSTLVCQRGAFLASNPSVNIDMEFTKSLSAGFFGGQGFILQKLHGQGDVLVKAGGTLVEKELKEGETLRVTSGSIVAFTSTVDYGIQMMPGIKNAMFGGEGLFVTKLTGPGKVWLQGMPADRMISEIARRVPAGGGFGPFIPIGGMGSGGEASESGPSDAVAEGGGTGEELVATTDQAIEADRQATVASSGMMEGSDIDADSPSALFGDAAFDKPPVDPGVGSAASSSSEPFASQSTFGNDSEFASQQDSFSSEPSFDDENSFSNESQSGFGNDSFFDDDPTQVDGFDASSAEEASEAGGGILSTMWDLFNAFTDDD